MKIRVLLFLLFFPLLTEAQNPDLIFTGSINSFTLRKTTHREIEKQFGEPDSIKFSYSNANIGSCIPSRHSYLDYTKIGLSFNCSSFGNKKTSKRKKWLRQLQYNETSGIILNEKIMCGKTNREDILKLFPDNQLDESGQSIYCSSVWNGKKVGIYFVFAENDILMNVKIE